MMDEKHVKIDHPLIDKKGWLEFRKAGLLFVVNQFLHIFGWAIIFEYADDIKDIENHEPTFVYVARTIFRGFDHKLQENGYKNITKYMNDNSQELLKEVLED